MVIIRRPIIAGNWKMYKNIVQTLEFIKEFKALNVGGSTVDVLICPPFISLAAASSELQGTNIALGAQNMYHQSEGAYTGEISPMMLLDAGCKYVILGHSERRQLFGETDQAVNTKVRAALACGLVPVVCVGEILEQRQSGITKNVIREQVSGSLEGLSPKDVAGLLVAYEPVWAIGTGLTASPGDAQEVNEYIRGLLTASFGAEAAGQVRILYGGSVKPDNTAQLMSMPDIDGALVGGASLKPSSFSEIIRAAGGV